MYRKHVYKIDEHFDLPFNRILCKTSYVFHWYKRGKKGLWLSSMPNTWNHKRSVPCEIIIIRNTHSNKLQNVILHNNCYRLRSTSRCASVTLISKSLNFHILAVPTSLWEQLNKLHLDNKSHSTSQQEGSSDERKAYVPQDFFKYIPQNNGEPLVNGANISERYVEQGVNLLFIT